MGDVRCEGCANIRAPGSLEPRMDQDYQRPWLNVAFRKPDEVPGKENWGRSRRNVPNFRLRWLIARRSAVPRVPVRTRGAMHRCPQPAFRPEADAPAGPARVHAVRCKPDARS